LIHGVALERTLGPEFREKKLYSKILKDSFVSFSQKQNTLERNATNSAGGLVFMVLMHGGYV
jgi:hypothetical protein